MRLRSWSYFMVSVTLIVMAVPEGLPMAVTLALAVVEHYGASPAKVVFATIGAMSAVGPTFTASLLACLTQICGVAVGGLLALTMIALQIPPVIGVGVGIVGILTGYQYFRLKLVPVLPCLVLVNACLNSAVEAAPGKPSRNESGPGKGPRFVCARIRERGSTLPSDGRLERAWRPERRREAPEHEQARAGRVRHRCHPSTPACGLRSG